MEIPSKLSVGDSVAWIIEPKYDNLGNPFLNTEYGAVYYFKKVGATEATNFDQTTNPNSSGGWDATLSVEAETEIGTYYYVLKMVNIDNEHSFAVESGQIEILANIEDDGIFEGRSRARQDLDAVQAAMRSIISGGAIAEYTIGSRSVRKMTMEDLIKLESKLKADVVREEKAEKIAQGLGNPNNLFVRFRR